MVRCIAVVGVNGQRKVLLPKRRPYYLIRLSWVGFVVELDNTGLDYRRTARPDPRFPPGSPIPMMIDSTMVTDDD